MRSLTVASVIILFSFVQTAYAQNTAIGWQLPLDVSDKNTSVRFDVDSTWHMVTGRAKGISGSVSLADPSDIFSVSADIHFPVKKIDTGWGMRDDSLQDSMQADKYSEVILKSTSIDPICKPVDIKEGVPCKTILNAELTIVNVTKKVELPIVIERKESEFDISGEFGFGWASYNIKDPSIFMAKVDPSVKVSYKITVPAIEVSP